MKLEGRLFGKRKGTSRRMEVGQKKVMGEIMIKVHYIHI
jgi:hypothetical protein